MILSAAVFHGRLSSLEVIKPVVVLVSWKPCFELVNSGKWVSTNWKRDHRAPKSESFLRKTAEMLGYIHKDTEYIALPICVVPLLTR